MAYTHYTKSLAKSTSNLTTEYGLGKPFLTRASHIIKKIWILEQYITPYLISIQNKIIWKFIEMIENKIILKVVCLNLINF